MKIEILKRNCLCFVAYDAGISLCVGGSFQCFEPKNFTFSFFFKDTVCPMSYVVCVIVYATKQKPAKALADWNVYA